MASSTRKNRGRAIALLLSALAAPTPARAVGPGERPAPPPASTLQAAELQWQLQAQKRLETMGFADWSPVVAGPSLSATNPSSEIGASRGQDTVFRARLVAPALAFLHGVSDSAGGLPEYGGILFAELQPGGSLALRASVMGELSDPAGRSTGLWIYDPSRLPERIQVLRSSLGLPR